jgi:hypothetical protein
VHKLSKPVLVMIALGMTGAPAQSRVVHIAGTAGYLSEWEFNGEVTEGTSSGGSELSGPLTFKHVGICSVNGPQEKRGEIKFRISRSGTSSKIDATISFDGARCAYSGPFTGSASGYMDCSDTGGVPLSISIK